MGYIYLITSILVENSGKIPDKYNFKYTSISPRESLLYVFSVMAVVVSWGVNPVHLRKAQEVGILYMLAAVISSGLLGIIAALLYGIGGVVDKLYLDNADLTNFFVFGSGGTTLALILMYTVHQKTTNKPLMPSKSSVYWKFVAIGIGLKALSGIAYFSALQKLDNVAHLSAVGAFSIILTILLGIVLPKERIRIKLKIAAGRIATIEFLLLI